MTQYGDNKCLDCEHNRKCYMRSIRANEYGVEFVCKKEEDKKIEKLELQDDGNTITLFGKNENEWTILNNVDVLICDKINEIIEVINERTL